MKDKETVTIDIKGEDTILHVETNDGIKFYCMCSSEEGRSERKILNDQQVKGLLAGIFKDIFNWDLS